MKIQTWITAGLAVISLSAQGALYDYNWTVTGGAIPDANPSGFVNNQTITDGMQGNAAFLPNPYIVSVVGVYINVSGGWNGDLYAYLRYETPNGTGFTTLLNRVGTGGGNPVGYTDAGFNNVFLTDNSGTDIHNYGGGGAPTGTYRVDQTGSSLSFGSFTGLDPTTGTWSLFFADQSGGHVSTLTGWGLELEVVPEPVNMALGVFCGVMGIAALARSKWAKQFLVRQKRI
jgi:hypothetical protein